MTKQTGGAVMLSLVLMLSASVAAGAEPAAGQPQVKDMDKVKALVAEEIGKTANLEMIKEMVAREVQKAGNEEKINHAIKIMTTLWAKWSLVGFGVLFGYFLFYGIRHGSRTQETFKAFLGVFGVSGTALGLDWLLGDPRLMAMFLKLFAAGCATGFLAYGIAAAILAGLRACNKACWSDWAAYMGRTVLGEDWPLPPATLPSTGASPKTS